MINKFFVFKFQKLPVSCCSCTTQAIYSSKSLWTHLKSKEVIWHEQVALPPELAGTWRGLEYATQHVLKWFFVFVQFILRRIQFYENRSFCLLWQCSLNRANRILILAKFYSTCKLRQFLGVDPIACLLSFKVKMYQKYLPVGVFNRSAGLKKTMSKV